jgi:hypothetical protein
MGSKKAALRFGKAATTLRKASNAVSQPVMGYLKQLAISCENSGELFDPFRKLQTASDGRKL